MTPPKILVVDDNKELLQLLSQLFEDAGYQVLSASKGRQAIDVARGDPPRAGVIDVLLPDLMGHQVIEQLRKENINFPVIFLTGVFRGLKHAEEAKEKHGAVAYLEKPFDAQKLLATLGAIVAPEQKSAPKRESFEVELDIDVEDDIPQDPMELTGRIKLTGDHLSTEIRGANLTAGALGKGEAGPVRPPPLRIIEPVKPAAGLTPRGLLKDNLPSLITAFHMTRETGELGVQRGKVKKSIYFESGQPVFALSNLVSDRFGQFLVRVGKIQQDQLQDAAAVATATKRRTGDVLVERGVIKDTERLYYVGQQVKAIIYSLFAWEEGSYVLSFKDKAVAESIKLDVHPGNLIIRGIKKLYKPTRMRRLLAPDDKLLPSLQPAYTLDELEFEKWETALLPRVSGTRTVGELVAEAGQPEHSVLAALCAFVALNIIEKRS